MSARAADAARTDSPGVSLGADGQPDNVLVSTDGRGHRPGGAGLARL